MFKYAFSILLALATVSASFWLTGCDGISFRPQKVEQHNRATGEIAEALLQDINDQLAIRPTDLNLLTEKVWVLLGQEPYEYGERAARALATLFKQGGGEGLIGSALKDSRWAVRRNTVFCVKRLYLTEACGILRGMVHDPEAEVRQMAVRAIGSLACDKAQFPLLLSLKDTSWEVRAEAARSLEKSGNPRSAKFLFRALDDADSFVQSEISAVLIDMICDQNESIYHKQFKRKNHPLEQRTAALALASRGDQKSLPLLKDILQDPTAVGRIEAVNLLWQLNQNEAERVFTVLLLDEPNTPLRQAINVHIQTN